MRKISFLLGFIFSISLAFAQMPSDKTQWTFTISPKEGLKVGDKFTLSAKAKLEKGMHVYSVKPYPPDAVGAKATEIGFDKLKGAKTVGKLKEKDGKLIEHYDEILETTLWYFEDEVTFYQEFQVTGSEIVLEGYLDYLICNEMACVPGSTGEFRLSAAASGGGNNQGDATPDNETGNVPEITPADTQAVDTSAASPDLGEGATGIPCDENLKEIEDFNATAKEGDSLWDIFLKAFAFGLAAIIMPCIFPMIPMTVSFFLKQSAGAVRQGEDKEEAERRKRRKGIQNALLYSFFIIMIYVAIGLPVSFIMGSTALYDMASNPYINFFYFVLIFVFALSFLGWFEITLPSSWVNKMDRKSDVGGKTGIFFMALTLALVSFSCTGPLVGLALVEASKGAVIAPIVGMLGFSIALALPFGIFALFPDMMKKMPKSGGWLNAVKVVLGFLELALALKFLSNSDLVWNWGFLTREVYLASWIVIFTLLGFYLIGKLRLPHDSPMERIPVPRLVLAIISFIFVIYMVPGMWGAPLTPLSGFLPPQSQELAVAFGGKVSEGEICELDRKYAENLEHHTPPGFCAFYDLEDAMEYGRKHNKPVFLDFTGHTCVNCRKMENTVWPNNEVQRLINEELVLVSLYTDDETPLPEIIETKDGKRLRDVGDQMLQLENDMLGVTAQPYYVIIDPCDTAILAAPRGFDQDIPAYIDFLNTGIRNYEWRREQ